MTACSIWAAEKSLPASEVAHELLRARTPAPQVGVVGRRRPAVFGNGCDPPRTGRKQDVGCHRIAFGDALIAEELLSTWTEGVLTDQRYVNPEIIVKQAARLIKALNVDNGPPMTPRSCRPG